jgi:hypothetical protein
MKFSYGGSRLYSIKGNEGVMLGSFTQCYEINESEYDPQKGNIKTLGLGDTLFNKNLRLDIFVLDHPDPSPNITHFVPKPNLLAPPLFHLQCIPCKFSAANTLAWYSHFLQL